MRKSWIAWPEQHEFGATEVHAFCKYARHIDQATFSAPIEELQDIRLDAAGRLQIDESQLSLLALKQLCHYVAAGLWTYVSDVGGIIRRRGRADSMLSPALAIRTLNQSLELRFLLKDGIRRRHLIKNTAARTIDGIVGANYKYLPHIQLYEAVEDFIVSTGAPVQFHSALLHGRRLAMAFCRKEPLFSYEGQPFYAGYYFSNSEAGECSVNVAVTIASEAGYGLGQFQRLPHTGKRFTKRLYKKLGAIFGLYPFNKPDDVEQAVARLSKPLGVVQNGRVDQKRRGALIHCLVFDRKIEGAVATRIANRLIYGEQQATEACIPQQSTYYDLWTGLLQCAAELHLSAREAAARTAYALLCGNLVI